MPNRPTRLSRLRHFRPGAAATAAAASVVTALALTVPNAVADWTFSGAKMLDSTFVSSAKVPTAQLPSAKAYSVGRQDGMWGGGLGPSTALATPCVSSREHQGRFAGELRCQSSVLGDGVPAPYRAS